MKKIALFVLLTVAVPLVAMQPANVDTTQALQRIEDKIVDQLIASGVASEGIYDEFGTLRPMTREGIRDLFKGFIQLKKDEYLHKLKTAPLMEQIRQLRK